MGNTLTKPSDTTSTHTENSTETVKYNNNKYNIDCNCNNNMKTQSRQNREILRELKSIKINLKYLNKKISSGDDNTYFNEKININNINNLFSETKADLNEKYSW